MDLFGLFTDKLSKTKLLVVMPMFLSCDGHAAKMGLPRRDLAHLLLFFF
jgi:hypothetical protein